MPTTRHAGRASNRPPSANPASAGRAIVVCYAATLFLSAGLLFAVQPLVARLILPRLGGSPAVWNTSLLFFQTLLLAGYAYTFLLTRWLPIRGQTVVQTVVVGLAMLALPLVLPDWTPPVEENPTPWLLAILTVGVGAPFFALATSAPLLQRWFAATQHSRASDPYFLYAWSNAGSLLALVAYPLVIEPAIGLTLTAWYWTLAYGAFVAMTMVAGVVVWRWSARTTPLPLDFGELSRAGEGGRRPGKGRRDRTKTLTLALSPRERERRRPHSRPSRSCSEQASSAIACGGLRSLPFRRVGCWR